MFKSFVNVLYKWLRHHSDLQLSCWYLAQGMHLKFLFYRLLCWLTWITIMIMMWTMSRELQEAYCISIIERALTNPDPTEPGSVSATMTFGLMDRYKCELQSYHSSCRWGSVAISRINSTIMIVQRKLHNFLCWSEPCLHCKIYCKTFKLSPFKRHYWILKKTRVSTMSNTSILG